MKKSVLTFLILGIALASFSQYDIVSNDDDTITTCSGVLNSGAYIVGTSYSTTFCSDDGINTHMIFQIADGYIFPSGTSLCIYDGQTTGSPLLVCYDSGTSAAMPEVQASSTNISGCLTFELTGDAVGCSWEGTVSCGFVCQSRTVDVITSLPVSDEDGFIDVCWDELNNQSFDVTFSAQGTYPDVNYDLDDENVTFIWELFDGNTIEEFETNTFNYNFLERQGYQIGVYSIDAFGCISSNYIKKRVRVSLPMDFTNTATPAEICLGDEVSLCSEIASSLWDSELPELVLVNSDTISIPDNGGIASPYEESIFIYGFSDDRVIESADDLSNITMKITHSFMLDLIIRLRCPNGQEVILHNQEGGNCNFGNPPNNGYTYAPSGTTTVLEAAIDNGILPPGVYAPYQSFDELIGCPVNGNWELVISDNILYDVGTVFGWSLEFGEDLNYPAWTYENEYEIYSWTPPSGGTILSLINEDCVSAVVGSTEDNLVDAFETFDVQVYDDFGCESHVPFELFVFNENHIDCINNYDIVLDNGSVVEACSSGIVCETYDIGESYSMTFCSVDEINTHMVFQMEEGFTFPSGTSLCIYDGQTTDSPLLVCHDSSTSSSIAELQASISNNSGCLTFEFIGNEVGCSWEGVVTCGFICIPRTVEIISAPASDQDGFIDVCWDELNNQTYDVTFSAQGTYPDVNYDLDDANVTFIWELFDNNTIEEFETNTFDYNFPERKGYQLSVYSIDTFGCISSNYEMKRVRVSLPMDYTNTATPAEICLGNEASLCTDVTSSFWDNELLVQTLTSNSDTVPIPDGTGITDFYEKTIFVHGLYENQLIENAEDLLSVRINIAHSYLGDLTIFLQCPSGQEVQLEEQGGGGCNLGNPPDEGYWYTIVSDGLQEMDNAASGYTTLPSGEYASYESFEQLIGCPLNGNWILKVADVWMTDLGTVFGWGLEFDQGFYPPVWEYQNEYEVNSWNAPIGSEILSSINEECANVLVSDVENNTIDSYEIFDVEIMDDFGCLSHIPFELLVLNENHIYCENNIDTEYDIVLNNGSLIETCSAGIFCDSYELEEIYTITFCSDDEINTHMKFQIAEGDPFPSATSLCIYDGLTTDAPLLICYDSGAVNSLNEIQASNTNVSGCLTFQFVGIVSPFPWYGAVTCGFTCMPRTVDLVTSLPSSNEDGYIDVCWDELNNQSFDLIYSAQGTYPEVNYDLDDENVTFVLELDNGDIIEEFESNLFSYNYPERKGYQGNVYSIDVFGCLSSNYLLEKVRVSLPVDYVNTASPTEICLGSEVYLCSEYSPASTWVSEFPEVSPHVYNDTVAIPDNSGVLPYEESILISGYELNQSIESAEDLLNVKINIAHSYLGDLTMFLRCPNGQEVQLEEQGGGQTDLGVPPDIGYLYTITPNASLTMSEASSGAGYLPAGEYASYQSFDQLVGCPLNGNWTLLIYDNWSYDVGTVFGWNLEFNKSVHPTTWSYQTEYEPIGWTASIGSEFFSSVDENCVEATYNYTENTLVDSEELFYFHVYDNFGCEHSLPLEVLVLNENHIDCIDIEVENENVTEQILVYPNPATDIVYIKNGSDVKIYDITSKLVMNVDTLEENQSVNISYLKPGTYIIEGYFNDKLKRFKLIKQ